MARRAAACLSVSLCPKAERTAVTAAEGGQEGLSHGGSAGSPLRGPSSPSGCLAQRPQQAQSGRQAEPQAGFRREQLRTPAPVVGHSQGRVPGFVLFFS